MNLYIKSITKPNTFGIFKYDISNSISCSVGRIKKENFYFLNLISSVKMSHRNNCGASNTLETINREKLFKCLFQAL